MLTIRINLTLCIGYACRADKNPYRHYRRADKNPYRHDRRADSQCHFQHALILLYHRNDDISKASYKRHGKGY